MITRNQCYKYYDRKLHPLVLKIKLELDELDKNKQKTWGERDSYRGSN